MIVAVVGGKGGVGKTTLSWNLGRELDAVVVDADLATADLPRGRGPDLHDVLAGRAVPMDAVERAGSVALLPAGRSLAGARACDLAELPATLAYLDRQFGRVIVDCPAGLSRHVGVPLEAADVAVLVTIPEKPAVVDAMKTRELAQDVQTPVACVGINRVPAGGNDAVLSDIERAFGVPTAVIPEEPAVAAAQAAWEPVRDVAPEADAIDGIERIAERLTACEGRISTNTD